ncbi:MAG TPA: NRDE family protein [Flavobacterium sp.]|nr:NRDE family protein [Flavobacterium sp.]
MCTVTFVRSGTKTIITSNRDEQVLRQAIEPRHYVVEGKNVVFPKDPQAGGTWYAIDEHANVLVLLNGAAEKHTWNPPYRKSRGLIVLDIISAASPYVQWTEIDLENIEPFTSVLFQEKRLYQLRWNGKEKNTLELDPKESHIWSSTMLYPKTVREKREKWFAKFLRFNSTPSGKEMVHFHQYTESGDTQNGLVINRNNFLKTLSITQTIIGDNTVQMNYHDLAEHRNFVHSFAII